MIRFELVTEDCNRPLIEASARKLLDSFTITEGVGYWQGNERKESSLSIWRIADTTEESTTRKAME